MKHIILIKDMSCSKCVERIKKGLEEVGISCAIDLAKKSVAIDRDGDKLALAKRVINELGYTIL